MNKKCCCFGHREVYKNISEKLNKEIENLIKNKGVTVFYVGGMGSFDQLFSSAVRLKKKSYPFIKLILVCPYLTQSLNKNKVWYEESYDNIIIPQELYGVYFKSAKF